MLASRGFAYTGKDAAEFKKGGGHYHANCDCRIVPGFDGMEVQGYDPDSLYRRYKDCVDALDEDWLHKSYDALPSEKRADTSFDDFKTKQILAEMRTRDPLWLNEGIVPEVGFETDQVEKRVLRTPHELRTATRIAQHGIEAFFIQDYKWVEDGGRKRKVGLPDFRGGIEIKTPMDSGNPYGALANYLDNSRKKQGLSRVIVDNTESSFSDEEIIRAAKEERRFYEDIPKLTLLLKCGKLKNI